MSSNWDQDDLARMLALEQAFGTLTFMWACQFADHQRTKPTQAVAQLRDAVLGSVFDSRDHGALMGDLISAHLQRMFDHVHKMASNADKGYDSQG